MARSRPWPLFVLPDHQHNTPCVTLSVFKEHGPPRRGTSEAYHHVVDESSECALCFEALSQRLPPHFALWESIFTLRCCRHRGRRLCAMCLAVVFLTFKRSLAWNCLWCGDVASGADCNTVRTFVPVPQSWINSPWCRMCGQRCHISQPPEQSGMFNLVAVFCCGSLLCISCLARAVAEPGIVTQENGFLVSCPCCPRFFSTGMVCTTLLKEKWSKHIAYRYKQQVGRFED